jgi:septal ring factor EnvC (AmiA/AmiB activator)
LDESEKELEASKAELEALRKEYEQQKAELMTLKEELRTQKNESATASDALTKANQFLQDTKVEIEAREAAWRKREAQLERQRFLWQIACVIVGGVAAAV